MWCTYEDDYSLLEDRSRNIKVRAGSFNFSEEGEITFKDAYNIDIDIFGALTIGKGAHFGNNMSIRANEVSIGDNFFHSSGLRVGGGGSDYRESNLRIGDRCTLHNNFINVSDEVELEDDVGLSPEAAIITHGFWGNALVGFPTFRAPVRIGAGCLIGYRATILGRSSVPPGSIVGAGAVLRADDYYDDEDGDGVFIGNPAERVHCWRGDWRRDRERATYKISKFFDHFKEQVKFHGLQDDVEVELVFYEDLSDYIGHITCNGLKVSITKSGSYYHSWTCETKDMITTPHAQSDYTDLFRNELRKFGVRIYTDRPFQNFRDIRRKK